MGLRTFLKQLLDDDRGQSTTEYILILSVVVLVALRFKREFQKQLEDIVGNLAGQIRQGIQE